MKKKLNFEPWAVRITSGILLLFIVIIANLAKAQTLSRQDKLFIQNGIQFQSWVPNDHFNGSVVVPARQPLTIGRNGRYIRIQLPNTETLSMAEIQVFSGGTNVALGKPTQQSSNLSFGGTSSLAVDGNTNGAFANGSVTSTRDDYEQMEPWWQVDLGNNVAIDSIVIFTRTDACCIWKFKGFYALVSSSPFLNNSLLASVTQSGASYYAQPVAPERYPNANELNNANIVPTYYQLPAFNYPLQQQDANLKWSIATLGRKLPPESGIRIPSVYETSNGFLNSMQTDKLGKLVSVCIGDEENYSAAGVSNLKKWFDIAKAKYPNVLTHSNQYPNQWSVNQLKSYMQTAQPDMITFDMYYYHYLYGPGPNAGNSYKSMYQDMQVYRNLALAGNDGSMNNPIPFGGYLQAFSGENPSFPGYYVSESEFNLNAFAYLTMGAKWLNEWLYKAFFWNYTTQQLTPQYYQVAKIGKEVANLSPHLSRLQTYDVRFVAGQNSNGTNALTSNIAAWSNTADPYVKNIIVTNLGSYNNGLKGDLLIGYFKPSAGLANTPDINIAPVLKPTTRYFMVLNGLSKPNGCCTTPASDTLQGKANLVRQKVTLTIDFGKNPIDTLYKVRRSDGVVETVPLTSLGNGQYNVIDTLDGGLADLFYWKNQGAPVASPTSGTSLQLSSGSVNAGNVTQLSGASKFTLETWVKFNATIPWSTIFSKYSSATNRIVLSTGQGNSLHLAVNNNESSYAHTTNNVVTTNQWYHIAMVYDGTQSNDAWKLKLFINGVQETLGFYDGSVPATSSNNTAPFRVGSYDPTNPFYLNGSVDEVRVWNTALSPEVIYNWNNKMLGSCHPNMANLKLYWPLNNGSNPTIATAEQGTAYAGSISNATYVTGGWATNIANCTVTAKAVQLSSGAISAGNVTSLSGVSKFTLETWVKFNTTTAWSTIFSKYNALTNRIVLSTGYNNSLRLAVTNGQDSYANTVSNLIAPNQWYHVAMVYDGGQSTNAGKLKLFLNGIEQALTFTENIPVTSGTNAASSLFGAYSPPANPYYLDGVIDEVRVWDTAISGANLLAWKDKALGTCHPNIANLKVYWQLDDNSNPAVAVPSLSTTYTGTITNGLYITSAQATGSSGCSGSLMSANTDPQLKLQTFGGEITSGKTIVYPNPVEGKLSLNVYKAVEEQVTVTLYNSIGQQVYQAKKQLSKGANELQLDFSNYTSGLYILKLKDSSGEEQFKIIKK